MGGELIRRPESRRTSRFRGRICRSGMSCLLSWKVPASICFHFVHPTTRRGVLLRPARIEPLHPRRTRVHLLAHRDTQGHLRSSVRRADDPHLSSKEQGTLAHPEQSEGGPCLCIPGLSNSYTVILHGERQDAVSFAQARPNPGSPGVTPDVRQALLKYTKDRHHSIRGQAQVLHV